MSEDAKITEEQLQQATSRALPAAPLDAQTAALREGFLQFGRAVEAANADFDEAALVAKLTQSLTTENSPTVVAPHKEQNSWWPALLTAALAASALVAIVRIVAVSPGPDTVVVAPAAPEPNAAQPTVPETNLDELPLLAAWSDPLDDEIASAQDEVEKLTGQATGLDGSLESFGSRLEALSAELESGSL